VRARHEVGAACRDRLLEGVADDAEVGDPLLDLDEFGLRPGRQARVSAAVPVPAGPEHAADLVEVKPRRCAALMIRTRYTVSAG
jgi:hypothetical protein